jgi:hypothetical protein
MLLENSPMCCFFLTEPMAPQRFYRGRHSGSPRSELHLDIALVPALRLEGTVGSLVRVDCINAIGPTDAWVTLDTVTLTNTTQLCFDTSAPGHPQRLYRLSSP